MDADDAAFDTDPTRVGDGTAAASVGDDTVAVGENTVAPHRREHGSPVQDHVPAPPEAPGYTGTAPYPNVAYGAAPAPIAQVPAPDSTLTFILGLGGFALPFLSPAAWYLGQRGRRQVREAPPGTYRDEGLLNAGWVMGIVGTVLLGLYVLLFLLAVVVILFAFGGSA